MEGIIAIILLVVVREKFEILRLELGSEVARCQNRGVVRNKPRLIKFMVYQVWGAEIIRCVIQV